MTQPSPTPNPVEIFMKSWQVYQTIIEHNYMYHRELSDAASEALRHVKPGQPLRLLDLGCGDASMVIPLLSEARVELYTGCDLSQPALDIAKAQLQNKKIPHRLLCDDMVRITEEQADASIDLVFSSYAIHHLNAIDKERTLREIARILSPGGCFLLIDIFREPDEDRAAYMDHYIGALRKGWHHLTEDARHLVVNHATEFDYPETPEFYATLCLKFGFAPGKRLDKHTWHEAWTFTK